MIAYLLRGIELAELITFLTCGTYLVRGYRHALPTGLVLAGTCYLGALFSMSLAVALNATVETPPSPGLVLVTVLMLPLAVIVAVVTAHTIKEGTRRK